MLSRIRHILATRHNVRAHFWQSLANYAQQGGSVVLGVVLARLLTPEDFGAVAYAAALIGLICMPLDWTAAQVLVADRGQTPELFSEVMSLGLLVMGAKLLVTLGVFGWQWMEGNQLTAILVAMGGIGLIAGTATGIYRAAAEGSGHFKANFHVQAITLSLSFIVGVGLAWADAGVYALAFMGLVTAFPPFFIFPRYVQQRFHWRFNRHVIKSRGADGFWMWLNGISSNGLTRVDRLFLGRAVGEAQLGNYTRAYNYTGLSHMILNSLMTNAAVVSLASAANKSQKFKILFFNLKFLMLGGIANFIVFYFFSGLLVPFIFGAQWSGSVPAFQAFASINIFTALLYVPITYILSLKRFKEIAFLRFVGFLYFICSMLALKSSINAPVVAYQMQASLLISAAIAWFFVFKFRDFNLNEN